MTVQLEVRLGETDLETSSDWDSFDTEYVNDDVDVAVVLPDRDSVSGPREGDAVSDDVCDMLPDLECDAESCTVGV